MGDRPRNPASDASDRDRLWARLRNPPGGRDARIMLGAQFVDRTGTGVWSSASVLYFTVETGFDARRIGMLLGLGGVAGVLGSPVAGRLAGRRPVRTLLIGCHLMRLVTLCVILTSSSFAVLLPAVGITVFGDRAAKTLEMLFASRVAGPERATYQGLCRSAANAGYALGAGIAAIGLAVGTPDAYRVLILCDALSFAAISILIRRIPAGARARADDSAETGGSGLLGDSAMPHPAIAEGPIPRNETESDGGEEIEGEGRGKAGAGVRGGASVRAGAGAGVEVRLGGNRGANPWRDPGYLGFVVLDIFMTTDDSVLNVGLPLWLLTRTKAPHALVPMFLLVNTVIVIALQMRVSAATKGPRDATKAVARYGVLLPACCICIATAAECGPWLASFALLGAACLQTLAELMRSVSSWELAVSLAPMRERAAYLGVAGMSQSLQKCIGPLALTGVVIATGPVGWLGLGAVVGTAAVAQRRSCLREIDRRIPPRLRSRNRLDLAG